MKSFRFWMPTELYFGKDCIIQNQETLRPLGKKALLVTGKSSAKKNGAQADVIAALTAVGREYAVFDEIEENPSVATMVKGAQAGLANGADFVIGIGGGSPMDAAKAIACLMANPNETEALLFGEQASYLPVVAVPTTAGTGSETTQYSIVTLHEKRTKSSIAQKIFPALSFLDAKYMESLSAEITNNTAVDALTHLIEAYLSTQASFLSDQVVQMGLTLFRECIPALEARSYSLEIREKLLLASTIAGMAIAQAGTSLPHAMGYFLTYEKNIPHGRANGMLTKAYLGLFSDQTKPKQILECLGFRSSEELGHFLDRVLEAPEVFTEDELRGYASVTFQNKAKLASFPEALNEEMLFKAFCDSLLNRQAKIQ